MTAILFFFLFGVSSYLQLGCEAFIATKVPTYRNFRNPLAHSPKKFKIDPLHLESSSENYQKLSFRGNETTTNQIRNATETQQYRKLTESSDLTVGKILRFAIPAIGIWFCTPLLSVIDTSSVGLIAGTVQQAALNPAVAVTDYSARCMSFLYTGTTNLVANAFEKDREQKDNSLSKQTLIGALRVSFRVGLGLCIGLLLLGRPMLKSLVGSNASGDAIVTAAEKYVWIRSLGMPAAAMMGSTQAACLGMQDVRSPLVITAVAALVNLVADLVLVRHPHPWIGGVAGAAWATTMSQYISILIYLQWLCHGNWGLSSVWKNMKNFVANNIQNKTNHDNRKVKDEQGAIPIVDNHHQYGETSTRGMLKNSFRFKDLLFRRSGENSMFHGFSPFVVPVTTTQVGRCSVYVAMGYVVSGLSVVNMAANQILNAFFYALIPIADALSQTAQALLPPIYAAKENKKERLRFALQSFLKVAALCGVALTGIVACIPWLTKTLMTSDPAVQSIVNTVVPIHMLIFSLHGIFCAAEGILLAQKDLTYLGRMYGLYFVTVPTIMLQLKRFGTSLRLQSIWTVFLIYQLFRISAWVGRVVWLYRKTSKLPQDSTEENNEDFALVN